jgi:hypothetical protein
VSLPVINGAMVSLGNAGTLFCKASISSHDMYTLLLTMNSILTLGSSWTAWDAVAESGVRSQVVTLGKCCCHCTTLEMLDCHCTPHCTPDI